MQVAIERIIAHHKQKTIDCG